MSYDHYTSAYRCIFAFGRSLVDLAGSSKQTSDLEPIVAEMYASAGLSDKDDLDFDDFKRLLTSKDENFMLKVGVDWKGETRMRLMLNLVYNRFPSCFLLL